MNETSKTPREQCSPSEADWYVEVIYGRTLCPHTLYEGKTCRTCDEHNYGTETDYNYGFFKGDRPTLADRASMIPEGFYRMESTVKPCKRAGESS
jgi:hypothetical protein